MVRIPVKLQNDPIVECTLELRFDASSEAASDVLPGMLYASFKDQYPVSEQTPEAQLPRAMRATDANLKARPIVLLKGTDSNIGIGDAGVLLSFQRPYRGWATVQPRADAVFGAVLETGLVEQVSRFSIKYTNLITTGNNEFDLSSLELEFRLGRELTPRGPGTALRAEFKGEETISIVQIQTGATVKSQKERQEALKGVLLIVDTISFGDIEDRGQLSRKLELLHNTEKDIFFRILTDKTREMLGPMWE